MPRSTTPPSALVFEAYFQQPRVIIAGDRRRPRPRQRPPPRRVDQAQPVPGPGQPPQRLLRPATPAGLPAPQRLPDLPRLPDHPRVPPRPPPASRHGTASSSPAPMPTATSASPATSDESRTASTTSSPPSKPSTRSRRRDPRRQHHPPAAAPPPTSATPPLAAPSSVIEELARTGAPVCVAVVAHSAGVSRSWLYEQPELLADINRLRERATAVPILAKQSALRGIDPTATRRRSRRDRTSGPRTPCSRAGRPTLGEHRLHR